ncbi:MAG TPA: BatD family protein [candidate division Zixibacteria bacterium]|nr:BatD family protein [candidate division Zixibacteria bacterium]
MRMSLHRRFIIGAAALALACLALAQVSHAAVSVELQIDRDQLAVSETTQLSVVIKGAGQDPEAPDVAGLGEFDILSRGSSMNFSSYNGVTEVSMTYTYTMAPKRVGTYTLGPATLKHNGATYTSNKITVVVTQEPADPGLDQQARQKDIFLEATVDKETPYVGEQVVLSVKFYTAVQTLTRPSFSAPQTTDFWTDQFPQRSYYTTVNGRRFRVVEISFALFPTRAGELEIGRATLQTEVPSQQRNNRTFGFPSIFGGGETVNLRTRPIQITALPLPDEGKPADFSGAVGRFSMSAATDLNEVEVNTPVSVTFRMQGTGNIKVLAKPEIPPLSDFRTYSGVSEEQVTKNQNQLGGVKTFEEIFIPTRQGELTIPAIEYNFFDPELKRYVRTRTKEITLKVRPSSGQLAEPSQFTFPSGGRVGSSMASIRYIKKQSSEFRRRGEVLLFQPLYVTVNAIPVLALALAVGLRRRRERLAGDVAYARSRGASRLAKKRLREAAAAAKVATAEKFFGEIRLAILAFVADKLNVSPHGLTLDDLAAQLHRAGFSDEEAQRCRSLLQRADYVRYSSGSITQADIDASLKHAEQILIRLQEANLG